VLVKYLGARRWSEGPERDARRRSADGNKVWGEAVVPPQYGGLRGMPHKIFQRINVEIVYFRHFAS